MLRGGYILNGVHVAMQSCGSEERAFLQDSKVCINVDEDKPGKRSSLLCDFNIFHIRIKGRCSK